MNDEEMRMAEREDKVALEEGLVECRWVDRGKMVDQWVEEGSMDLDSGAPQMDGPRQDGGPMGGRRFDGPDSGAWMDGDKMVDQWVV